MTAITIEIVKQNGEIIKSEGVDFCNLATRDLKYTAGDKIRVTTDEPNQHLVVKLDETLDTSFIFMKDKVWEYLVPVGESALEAMSDVSFLGQRHCLSVRVAYDFEVKNYRNLALNPHDQKEESGAYPHAYANVETRTDSTFFARNVIDGIYANDDHGSYPYQSWGINQQKDAELTIDFGREVEVNRLALTLRGDYPHDSYWTEVTVIFSDESQITLNLEKVLEPQFFSIDSKKITWIKLCNLIKAEDESPFPALTEFEVFGRDI